MTDLELKELQKLLLRLKKIKPEFTVLIAEVSEKELFKLMHETDEFYCELITQIDCCLDDKENKNLRN